MSNAYRHLLGRNRTLPALLVSAGVLGVLMYKTNIRLERVVEVIRGMDWRVLAGMFLFSTAWHILVGADKWYRILRTLGAPVGYREVLRVRLGSDPIRFASPLKLGEIVNAAYFARTEAFGFSRAAGSIAFDKALNFVGTLFWLYLGLAAMLAMPGAGHLLAHSAIGLALVGVLALPPLRQLLRKLAESVHPKLGRLAGGVLAAFEEFSPGQKLGFVIYGILFQLRPLIVCYLLFVAIDPARMPSMQEFLAYGSIAVLMSNVPFTVGGFGPREAAVMALFSSYGSPAVLLSVGVLMSLSIQVIPALVGIPFMFPLLRSLAVPHATGEKSTALAGETPEVRAALEAAPMEEA